MVENSHSSPALVKGPITKASSIYSSYVDQHEFLNNVNQMLSHSQPPKPSKFPNLLSMRPKWLTMILVIHVLVCAYPSHSSS